jgi:CheY-like chemotaxis protein
MTAAAPKSSGQRIYRVLCVDDNQFGMYVNAIILRNEGYEVLTCSDAEEAAAIAEAEEIDLAVLDYQMPVMNGAELAALCKAANPEMKVILFSGSLGIPKRELALFDLFVSKSEGIEALLEGIEALFPGSRTRVRFSSKPLTATNA